MDQSDNYVYIKVNYAGFIPVLNANGPIRSMWAKKEDVKNLIRSGYDITFINRNACPEFCKQMDEYRKFCNEKDYVGAKSVLDTVFKDDPNSVVNQAIKASENIGNTDNAATDAVQNALNASGINSDVEGGITDQDNSNEYADQLNGFEGINDDINDVGMGEYDESGDSNVMNPADGIDFTPDSAPDMSDESGEIQVFKNKKKNR